LPCEPFGQGFASMSAPSKMMETLVLSKQINHGGHKVLRWSCSNISIKTDPAQNIKLDKSKSTERIDPMVALVMALGCYMNDDSSDNSTYDDRGIMWI